MAQVTEMTPEADQLIRRYFKSWMGDFRPPFRPLLEIEEAEARRRPVYYVGYYDVQERLVRFEKFLGPERLWQDNYTYWATGKLQRRRFIRLDGTEIAEHFDELGRRLGGGASLP